MEYISDDEVREIDELMVRISEAISERDDFRTEYLRNRLSIERIVQNVPVGSVEAWMITELEKWGVAEYPPVKHLLSLAQEFWPQLSTSAKSYVREYCHTKMWSESADALFNQIAAEILDALGSQEA